MSRLMVALALLGAVSAVGCRASAARPRGPDADDAVVKIRTAVEDADLWFDGRFVGPVNLLRSGIAVEPGKHRLEVRHEEYFSHYQELELAPRQRLTIDVELAPVFR